MIGRYAAREPLTHYQLADVQIAQVCL